MSLKKYREKRNFKITKEPSAGSRNKEKGSDDSKNTQNTSKKKVALIYVMQKHASSHLHYDLRLEMNNVLKSWAVPKGPSLDPKIKRLAVEVEDHPIEYAKFEGVIPKGQYGAGEVIIWDKGDWQSESNPHQAYKKGDLTFSLTGKKLKGLWKLIKIKSKDNHNKIWLLIKMQDKYASKDYDIVKELPLSVVSRKDITDLKKDLTKAKAKTRMKNKKSINKKRISQRKIIKRKKRPSKRRQ